MDIRIALAGNPNSGKASFSAVQDAKPETLNLGVKLSTETAWGDYLIVFGVSPRKYRCQNVCSE